MPLNPNPCWNQQIVRFDYAFADDQHPHNEQIIYVRKTARDASFDMSLKFRWAEGIRRYELPEFVEDIKKKVMASLQQNNWYYQVDTEAPRQQMRTLTVFNVPEANHWAVAELIANAYLDECASRNLQPFG